MSRLSRSAILATYVRSFFIQAAWNYHTMLGTGFAFTLLPGLRRIHDGDTDAMNAGAARHLEHFNAHPYLAGLARQGRSAEPEAVCSTPFDSRGWTGEERRGRSVDSFDPYIVELTRPNRSEF